ncbi:MAG: HAD family hydrolase [Rhodospirillales bacterium]
MSPPWPLGLPRPRALLFDWDNTLVDNWTTIASALNVAFGDFGKPAWTLAEVKARVRGSMRESFPAMFGPDWRRAGEIFYAAFRRTHLETLKPMPGADAMLAGLAGRGLYLGVVSNKHGPFLRAEAAHLGWTGHFGAVVGAADAPRDKPAAEPVRLALAPGGKVWLVGDADIDMECAHNAGCTAVLLHPDPPGADWGPHRPALHLAGCGALLALLA